MTKEELKALGITDEQVTKILDDQGRISSPRPSSTPRTKSSSTRKKKAVR